MNKYDNSDNKYDKNLCIQATYEFTDLFISEISEILNLILNLNSKISEKSEFPYGQIRNPKDRVL